MKASAKVGEAAPVAVLLVGTAMLEALTCALLAAATAPFEALCPGREIVVTGTMLLV